MSQGKFIVIEGGEGSGKDTQIELLTHVMPNAVITREPGGTKLGGELRKLLLDWRDREIDALSEIFLFSAARVHFMKDVVRPALAAGKTVITNRFALSTIAYQVYGRERPDLLDTTRTATKAAVGIDMPNLTILLDVDPAVGLARVTKRADGHSRFDTESLEFHERVRAGYVKHVADFGPHAVINASGSVEEVWAETKKVLMQFRMI